MKPAEFLRIAEDLAAGNTEAQWRSAVSRVYYGAFHEARLLLRSCGVSLSGGNDSHAKVSYCLQRSADPSVPRAATKLGLLRSVRNDADYELAVATFDAHLAIANVVDCTTVAKAFQSADPATASVGVREYARDILRMNLST